MFYNALKIKKFIKVKKNCFETEVRGWLVLYIRFSNNVEARDNIGTYWCVVMLKSNIINTSFNFKQFSKPRSIASINKLSLLLRNSKINRLKKT